MSRFTLLFLAALFLTACTPKETTLARHWKDWANLQADLWLGQAELMRDASLAYCNDVPDISAVQDVFTDLLSHWAYMNGYPYKAIEDKGLAFSLYFWPDKRNMTQIRLSSRVESDGIEEDYVAAERGIPALEWLLYKDDISPEARCVALPQVSELYLQDIQTLYLYHQSAPVVLEEWTLDNKTLGGRSISLNLLYAQVSRLEAHLRQSRDEDGLWISYVAEGWLSGNTWNVYANSLAGIAQMLEITGQSSLVNAENKAAIFAYLERTKALATEFQQLRGRQQNPELLDRLEALLSEQTGFIETALAKNFSVLIGFNNFDGD